MATTPKGYALTPLAEADLEGIYLYTLRTWSREQAVRYHGDLVAAFEGLAAGTRKGRPGAAPIDGRGPTSEALI